VTALIDICAGRLR